MSRDCNDEAMMDPYSSHLPLLVAAVTAMSGRVVELGAGWYSTPVLKAICGAQWRALLTIESDREWLRTLYDERSELHEGLIVANWQNDLHRYGSDLRCDVAFIDLAPAAHRASAIAVMRLWAKVIVVHDTETEQQHNYPGVEEQLKGFRYRIDDRRREPWTTAVSNIVNVTDLLSEAIA